MTAIIIFIAACVFFYWSVTGTENPHIIFNFAVAIALVIAELIMFIGVLHLCACAM